MPALPRPATTSDFSLSNLPYGMARLSGGAHEPAHTAPCTRVGDFVVDLTLLCPGDLPPEALHAFAHHNNALNAFMALGKPTRVATRRAIAAAVERLVRTQDESAAVHPVTGVEAMLLPCVIGDYTDFYASRQHAVNAGTLYRGAANALQPNWVHLPVGYHGRSSSVVVSGTPIVRPHGQLSEGKEYAPSRRLDFELEVGVLIGGPGNALGDPVSVAEARSMVFGYVLLNDWSARDVQAWEYVPLGPFCAKNFATSISPWVVPAEALDAFLLPSLDGPKQTPQPLPYLRDDDYALPDVRLSVTLETMQGREHVLCTTSMRNLHWTPAQMIAHHTSTGCNLRPGDLLGTGTISGADGVGSMLEASSNGQKPVALDGSDSRAFLLDGDTVVLRGWAGDGAARVGFGECRGTVLPARRPKL